MIFTITEHSHIFADYTLLVRLIIMFIRILLFLSAVSLVTACNNELKRELAPKTADQSMKTENHVANKQTVPTKHYKPAATPVITHYAYVKTSAGKFVIGLYGEDAPETVANFIGLCKMNYYTGVHFHRVARNFLIQTGDKLTVTSQNKEEWGTGGETFNGKELNDELFTETTSYKEGYRKGAVAMANKGPNTGTSQFFICLAEAVNMEHKWPIFGRVIDGLELIDRISEVDVEPGKRGRFDGIPLKPIKIVNIKITLVQAPRQ